MALRNKRRRRTYGRTFTQRQQVERLEARWVLDSTLVFNEVLYHPEDGNSALEFVELYNQMAVDLDISNWSLAGGVEFTFPAGTVAPGRSYLVVAADPAALEQAGGPADAFGPFVGDLANEGEELLLMNNDGRRMNFVDYGTDREWPVEADGAGVSLAKIDAYQNSHDYLNWTFSERLGGTPGVANDTIFPDPGIDETWVTVGDTGRVLVPTSAGELPNDWHTAGFDAQGQPWFDATNGVGYDETQGVVSRLVHPNGDIGNQLSGVNASAFARFDFDLATTSGIDALALDVNYDDGFVAYLNGTEVARRNAPAGSPEWNSTATDEIATLGYVDTIQDTPNQGAGAPIAYWRLNEGPGSFFATNVGTGGLSLNGFYQDLTTTDSGLVGDGDSAVRFSPNDGAGGSFVNGTGFAAQAGGNVWEGDWTIEAWFVQSSSQADAAVFSANTTRFGNSLNGGPGLVIDGGRLGIDGIGTAGSSGDVGIDLPDHLNKPVHAVITKTGGNGAGEAQFTVYANVDGTWLPTATGTNSDWELQLNDGFFIGRYHNDLGSTFDGTIDEVAVYRRALTSAEVELHFLASGNVAQNSLNDTVPFAGNVELDLTNRINLLQNGANVLAIQGLNIAADDGDFLIDAALTGHRQAISSSELEELRINEIAPASGQEFWVELYNPTANEVDLFGVQISSSDDDHPTYTFGNSTIPAGGYHVVDSAELGFRSDQGDRLYLWLPGGNRLLDGQRATNRLRGTSPTDSEAWLFPSVATPGAENVFDFHDEIVVNEIMYSFRPDPPQEGTPPTVSRTVVKPLASEWRYNQSGAALPADWASQTHAVDNQSWFSGVGLFGVETSTLPEPIRTAFVPTNIPNPFITTYYFETEFDFNGDVASTELSVRHYLDDGAVYYLNGVEAARFNMPGGPVDSTTLASTTVANASSVGPLTLDTAALVQGTNRLSVEVHQASLGSSDIVFGAEISVGEVVGGGGGNRDYRSYDEEWIELYNRSNQSVDLNAWELRGDIDYEFPAVTIEPDEYLVVARDPEALQAKYPNVNIVGGYSGRLGNKTGEFRLLDAANNPVDELRYYDGGRWPAAADGGGSSLELRDPFADNSNASAWAASVEDDDSEWTEISYRRVAAPDTGPTIWNEFVLGFLDGGEALIDDVSVVLDPDGQARELIQNGDFQLDAIGAEPNRWRIVGNHEGRVDVDPENAANRVLRLIGNGPTEHQSNHAETTFVNNTSVVNGSIYEVSYRAKWVSGAPQVLSRFYVNRVAHSDVLPVPLENGTPGAVNSTFVSNLGPTYTDFRHAPLSPLTNEPVVVSVTATDDTSVDSMRLLYSVNSGAFISTEMTLVGDQYQGTIPGQASSRTVQFFVEGTDSLGATSTFPPAGPDSSAMYRVNPGVGTARPVDKLQVITRTEDAVWMYQDINLMNNGFLGATVIYNEDEVYYDVGVRLKGSPFGRSNTSLNDSYSLDFRPEQPFRGEHERVSIDGSGRSNPGFNTRDEILVKHMMSHAGGMASMYDDVVYVFAPQTNKSGTKLLQLARYDNGYLDEMYENGTDGHLFEFEAINFSSRTVDGNPESRKLGSAAGLLDVDIRDFGDDKEFYRWNFMVKNNRDEDDFSRIIDLGKALSQSGAALDTATQEVMDVDQWMRTFAMMALAGNLDVYTYALQHNIFLYVRPGDNKVEVLPWDMDFSFSLSINEPLGGSLNLSRVIALPTNQRLYHGHLHDMIETSFNSTYLTPWAARYSTLTGENYNAQVNYINARANFVRSQFPAEIPFTITTNNGQDFSVDGNSVTLAGQGWINVREVWLEGAQEPLEIEWTSASTWEVDVPLQPGENSFTLQAFDYQGAPTGTDTIIVTSTLGAPALVDSLRVTEINYNPFDPAADSPFDNDDFEFIEVTNIAGSAINLRDARFTAGITYTFGNVNLGPNEHFVLVRNQTAFESRYGANPAVLGEYTGALDNSGEQLEIVDALGQTILSFEYNDNGAWPGRADGNGSSLEIIDPTGDYNDSENWRSSTEFSGSPGVAGLGTFADVIVNEVLSHTDLPSVDTIELYNMTGSAIDIGGWFLSDSNNDYFKFQVPLGTTIEGNGYLTFDESDFNVSVGVDPKDFSLNSARGDDVWLIASDAQGNPVRFADRVEFLAQANAESWGRWPNATGELYPMTSQSLGQENPGPRVGPIVVTEFMFHPPDPDGVGGISPSDLEFVEIYNPTADAIDLTNWSVSSGVNFSFAAGTMLGAGDAVVVVGFDPPNVQKLDDFRTYYGIGNNVTILGGYSGNLSNTGETIRLFRPDEPPADEPTFIPELLEDEVRYDEMAPWPTDVSATGLSLHRVADDAWGNAAESWQSATPTPGSVGDAGDAPIVESLVVNTGFIDAPEVPGQGPSPSNWAEQRGDIRNIVVTFDQPIVASVADIRLTNLGVDLDADEDVEIMLEAAHVDVNGNTLTISFANQELPSGAYQLELLSTLTSAAGAPLDGNGDGNGGDDYVYRATEANGFYKLTGDWNGDGGVTIFDFATLAYWFGTNVNDTPAPEYVDLNDDLGISIFDFPIFQQSFTTSINWPIARPIFAAADQQEPTVGGDDSQPGEIAESRRFIPLEDATMERRHDRVVLESLKEPAVDEELEDVIDLLAERNE